MRRPHTFDRVVLVDARVGGAPGEQPTPAAMLLVEPDAHSRTVWRDPPSRAQYDPVLGGNVLVVCLDAEAVLVSVACWELPLPRHVIDLGVEARMQLNGLTPRTIADPVLALVRFGIAKAPLIERVGLDRRLKLGPAQAGDMPEVLHHLDLRMDCLTQLWCNIEDVNVSHALLRGRYLRALAPSQLRGWPIDLPTARAMERCRDELLDAAIARSPLAPDGLLFFRRDAQGVHLDERVLRRIARNDPDWPVGEGGNVLLDDKALDLMERSHAELRGIVEIRRRVDGLRYRALPIGSDGRHRYAQRPFTSSTGRNQPLGREALPMQAKWRRHLIVPPPGRVLVIPDYSSEEMAIVAAQSGDSALQAVYRAEDPYLWMAHLFGMAPADATKDMHERVRDVFKVVSLAVQYGGGPGMIAANAKITRQQGADLLAQHRRMFPRFWAWSEAAVTHGTLHASMETVFGWRRHVEPGTSPRTLQNFPAQANAGDILRLATIGVAEAGLGLVGTIHDAVAVEAAEADADAVAAAVEHQMVRAGKIVLGGFELKAKPITIRSGDRWREKKGVSNWKWVVRQLQLLGVEVLKP